MDRPHHGAEGIFDERLDALMGPGAAPLCAALEAYTEPVGIVWAIRDEDGQVADFVFGYGNAAIARLFDVDRRDVVGRYRVLVDVETARSSGMFDRYRSVVETGAPIDAMMPFEETVHGHVMRGTFLQRLVRLGDDGVLIVMRDVTAQHQAEAELRRSNAELEQFANVVAHDLREPLIALGRFVEVLSAREAEQLSGQGREVLAHMADGIRQARTLIDGVLQVARVGRGGVDAAEVDTAAVVERLRELLGEWLRESGATLEVGDLPAVRGRSTDLSRLFQNLITNAVKFRAQDPPVVQVYADRDDGGWVFTVRDNGVGVPADLSDRIFEMFTRGGDSLGTGIGLAVSRRVVESHGGRIWVERPPEGGSAFRFTLPAGA